MKLDIENNKAITLISLVITIIVLLILAAVSINYAVGDGGIIKKTQNASEKHRIAEMTEEINYLFAKPSASKNSVDILDYLNDLSNPNEANYNENLKDYEIIQHADNPEEFDLLIEWKPENEKASIWFKLGKNKSGVYEVTENFGIDKPSGNFSNILKIHFLSDGNPVKIKRVIKGNPVGKLPTIVKDSVNFKGWYTSETGGSLVTEKTITPENLEDVNYYALWGDTTIAETPSGPAPDNPVVENSDISVKYAVQIYGINQDVDAYGNVLGLTFGPAVGADYNNAYVTHKYEETSQGSGQYNVKIVTHNIDSNGNETTSEEFLTNSSGNKVTRTAAEKQKYDVNMHEMSWAEIKAVSDKTVFTDCMLCGDTKGVTINLNSTIASGEKYTQYGDGAGTLFNSIKWFYRRWNPVQAEDTNVNVATSLDNDERANGSNARNNGGYSVSHIRATLIGKNNKTNEEYAGNINLTEDTCLFNCLESSLQAAITPKKIKYVTGSSKTSYRLNEDISDSIWLFSDRELYSTGEYSGNALEGIGENGIGYDKFGNIESKFYVSKYKESSNPKLVFETETGGNVGPSWLRSVFLMDKICMRKVNKNGYFHNTGRSYGGLAFGFCIK